MPWKRLSRKTVYSSKFVSVFEDSVKLPNGKIINDYTLIQKPSIVVIVATDTNGQLIKLREYKYAANKTLFTLPAGHIAQNEEPLQSAKRELLEETGYGNGQFSERGILYEYPTKDLHIVHVIRAINVEKIQETVLESTEQSNYSLISITDLRNEIKNGQWKTSISLAAFALTGMC